MLSEIMNDETQVLMGVYEPVSPYLNLCSIYKNLYWSFNQINILKNKNNFCTAFFIIKKSIFNKVKGFDERLRIGEDRDFGEKIINNGFNYYSKPTFKASHYKMFNFYSLMAHHLENSKSVGLFISRKIFKKKHLKSFTQSLNTNHVQLISIPLSFLILSFFLLMLFNIFSLELMFFCFIFSISIFLISIKDFIRFVYVHYEYKIAILSITLYFCEQIIAGYGMVLAFMNHIYKKLRLDK